jgi:ribosome-binding factor A
MALCAETFLLRSQDPRLNAINVTRAQISGDLKKALIFYSVLGGAEKEAQAKKALTQAKGYIRAQVGEGLGLKAVPELSFTFDRNPEYAQRLSRLLTDLNSKNPDLLGTATELNSKNSDLLGTETELNSKNLDLLTTETELNSKNLDLLARETELNSKNSDLLTTETELNSENPDLLGPETELNSKNFDLLAKVKATETPPLESSPPKKSARLKSLRPKSSAPAKSSSPKSSAAAKSSRSKSATAAPSTRSSLKKSDSKSEGLS